ncbi:MAG: urease accessory protein UreD [Methanomicrobiales archaeon]|nr:urease accessory protein UreD [Methanomicrobiales archaeon]
MTPVLLSDCSAAPSLFGAYEAEKTRLAVGSAGKHGVARLEFMKSGDKTHLANIFNQIPARVLRALYYDPYLPGLPYVIFVNPTGGIVQGDRYEYTFHLGEGAEAFITDSMATKIYKMDLNYASRQCTISLGRNSRLEYLPREVIAFADSRWHQSTTIHMEDGAALLYSEIFCPGRIASSEFFDFSVFSSKFLIEKEGRPLLLDSILLRKEDKAAAGLLFGGHTFLLTAYWCAPNLPEKKPPIEFGAVYGGITEMPSHGGYIVKALARDLDALKRFQLHLWAVFRKVQCGADVPSLRIY